MCKNRKTNPNDFDRLVQEAKCDTCKKKSQCPFISNEKQIGQTAHLLLNAENVAPNMVQTASFNPQ